MSRLTFDVVPEGEWTDRTRRVIDACFRSLREVLEGGVRMREQFRTVECVIDTATAPLARITVPGVKKAPLAVQLLSAAIPRSSTGIVISSAALTWEWRSGQILIHAAGTLAAATRYDCVIAVLE